MRKDQKGNPAEIVKGSYNISRDKKGLRFAPPLMKVKINTTKQTVMKKHIVIIAGLVMFSLSLAAQNQRDANARVTEMFEKTFPDARNVRWTLLKDQVRKAQFAYQGNSCMAFFNANASLICSGKKIKDISTLPQLTAQALQNQKDRLEKKVGILNHYHTYEIVRGNTTKYFSTLGNQKALIVVSTDASGYSVVESRKINKSAPEITTPAPRDVIAKQP